MSKTFGEFISAVLLTCFSAWTLKEYLGTFLEEKKNNPLTIFRLSIFAVWHVFSMLCTDDWPNYIVLLISVLSVSIVSLNYKDHLIKKVAFTIVYNSIWMLTEFLVGLMFIVLGCNYTSQELLGSLLSLILLFLLIQALKHFFCNENIREVPHSYSIVLNLIPLGSMFVVYTSFIMSVHSQQFIQILWSFVSLLIMLFINILIFTIYLKLSEDFELRQRTIVYQQEIELYNRHIEEKENSMLKFRKAKHDLKNQLIYLMQLSENKEYEELKQFLESIIEKAAFDDLTIAQTDNSVVDALVNHKYAYAKKIGIDFKVKLEIPTHLPFDSADLCIILGNVLDNALEANIRVKIQNAFIKLYMRMDINNLLIIVENSFDGHISKSKEGRLQTLKADRLNHGLGLESVKKSVNKYHGYINTSYREYLFITEILLYAE